MSKSQGEVDSIISSWPLLQEANRFTVPWTSARTDKISIMLRYMYIQIDFVVQTQHVDIYRVDAFYFNGLHNRDTNCWIAMATINLNCYCLRYCPSCRGSTPLGKTTKSKVRTKYYTLSRFFLASRCI